ncbi:MULTISPECIES: metalloregulator ArsR/SmtB family transcription factor [unclassified Chromohalobacter]|uniref:ArsR/SmtB family transcription factor n=1 Tax=unclassified Chromohalobacter TaxID=2628571 RepID=UPI00246920F9|nr:MULTISPECIES: metalloregulator ArsR/SmtB family transcription factor [unclassified Chromohalobacter]
METNDALSALSALAQRTRLAIFRYLVGVGPDGAFAGDIAEALEVSPSTLSFHLKELSHAGLVHGESHGRHVHYRADFSHMRGLVDYLTAHCCDDQPEQCRLSDDAGRC